MRETGINILVEFWCLLILACGVMGHVAEGYFKKQLVTNVKGKQQSTKLHCPSVLALHT